MQHHEHNSAGILKKAEWTNIFFSVPYDSYVASHIISIIFINLITFKLKKEIKQKSRHYKS
jgi:hypothetical protein